MNDPNDRRRLVKEKAKHDLGRVGDIAKGIGRMLVGESPREVLEDELERHKDEPTTPIVRELAERARRGIDRIHAKQAAKSSASSSSEPKPAAPPQLKAVPKIDESTSCTACKVARRIGGRDAKCVDHS